MKVNKMMNLVCPSFGYGKVGQTFGGVPYLELNDVALLGRAGERDLGICGAEIGSHDEGLSVRRAHCTSDIQRSQ